MERSGTYIALLEIECCSRSRQDWSLYQQSMDSGFWWRFITCTRGPRFIAAKKQSDLWGIGDVRDVCNFMFASRAYWIKMRRMGRDGKSYKMRGRLCFIGAPSFVFQQKRKVVVLGLGSIFRKYVRKMSWRGCFECGCARISWRDALRCANHGASTYRWIHLWRDGSFWKVVKKSIGIRCTQI